MPQVNVPFPKLGLNRNFLRSNPTGQQQGYYASFMPESSWNMVNVVPYDRNDRLRGATRPGTLSQVNLNAGPVMGMAQVVSYPPPVFTTYLDDTFPGAFTQGQPIETGGIYSVACETNATTGGFGLQASPLPSDTLVTSTGVQADQRGTNFTNVFFYRNVAGNVIDNFTATTVYTVPSATSLMTFGYIIRFDPTAKTGILIQVTVNLVGGSVNIFGATSTPAQVNMTPTSSSFAHTGNVPTSVTLGVTVNQGQITVVFNGTQVYQGISNYAVGQTGTGPQFYNGGSVPTTIRITEHKITSPGITGQRLTSTMAVAGGNVYAGSTVASLALVSGGTGVVNSAASPSICYTDGATYIVDGVSILQVNVPGNTMVSYAATAGTAPVAPSIATVWRGRLAVANIPNFPQNFYMSRVGVATDWDYSQVDSAAAFAGNASTAGHIGDPITALIPFTDDVMIIGGDHNIWRVNGDPADGGSIDLVSDAIGITGPSAWTKDPSGNLWWVGAGGLYQMAPGGMPQNMTSKAYNLPFTLLDRTTNIITLNWDRDAQGLRIFFADRGGGVGVHYFYDARNGGLWPFNFPLTYGPPSTLMFDGNNGNARVQLLGCWDGKIRSMSNTLINDDGVAIASNLSFGPFQLAGPGNDAVITGVDVTLGENVVESTGQTSGSINAIVTLRGGKSAFEVTDGTSRHTSARQYTFAGGGRQLPMRVRVRGGWFAVELFNSTLNSYWNYEQINITFEPQGKQR